jgi:hypothetical protein
MPEEIEAQRDPLDQPPPYAETAPERRQPRVVVGGSVLSNSDADQSKSNLSAADPDLARSARTHVVIGIHDEESGVYYRRGGRITREPLTTPLDDLRERVALEPTSLAALPPDLAARLSHAVPFRLAVLWALADDGERRAANTDLLSLRHELQPVWKWTKAGHTGFWRSSLDAAVEAGWWDAGNQLGLVVCGVDARMAAELHGKWSKVFALTQHQIDGHE